MEQKNYSVVRRAVGYQRFDTAQEGLLLNQLYDTLRLYTNFFQPVMKLKSKERIGSQVKRHYDAPLTPYQRVLDSADVAPADKERLRLQYQQLNPAALKKREQSAPEATFHLGQRQPITFGVDFYMRQ